VIDVADLTKTYRIARKQAGLAASVKSIFSRTYEDVEAVKAISFSIPTGERVGFLGPNGAGKTTTLKMLAGLLTPTSGRISVLGLDPRRRPRTLLEQISLVMGQKQQLIWDLPPIDTLDLNRAIYQIERARYDATLAELTELLELAPLLDKPSRQLSLGERMKCELAAALIHRPKVLFLDEPTIGLDVTMQAAVRSFIKTYNEKTGATVLLTSHYMDDVAELCPRVIVIDEGRIRHDGKLAELIERTHPKKLIRVHLSRPVLASEVKNGTFRITEHTDGLLEIAVAPDKVTETVKLLLSTLPVADLRVQDPPLEDTMRQFFGTEGRAG
jgi:ABC-2 type transport system ATP-binding protein